MKKKKCGSEGRCVEKSGNVVPKEQRVALANKADYNKSGLYDEM